MLPKSVETRWWGADWTDFDRVFRCPPDVDEFSEVVCVLGFFWFCQAASLTYSVSSKHTWRGFFVWAIALRYIYPSRGRFPVSSSSTNQPTWNQLWVQHFLPSEFLLRLTIGGVLFSKLNTENLQLAIVALVAVIAVASAQYLAPAYGAYRGYGAYAPSIYGGYGVRSHAYGLAPAYGHRAYGYGHGLYGHGLRVYGWGTWINLLFHCSKIAKAVFLFFELGLSSVMRKRQTRQRKRQENLDEWANADISCAIRKSSVEHLSEAVHECKSCSSSLRIRALIFQNRKQAPAPNCVVLTRKSKKTIFSSMVELNRRAEQSFRKKSS